MYHLIFIFSYYCFCDFRRFLNSEYKKFCVLNLSSLHTCANWNFFQRLFLIISLDVLYFMRIVRKVGNEKNLIQNDDKLLLDAEHELRLKK